MLFARVACRGARRAGDVDGVRDVREFVTCVASRAVLRHRRHAQPVREPPGARIAARS